MLWQHQQQQENLSIAGNAGLDFSSDPMTLMTTAQLNVEAVYYVSFMLTMSKATSSTTCTAINLLHKVSRNWGKSSSSSCSYHSSTTPHPTEQGAEEIALPHREQPQHHSIDFTQQSHTTTQNQVATPPPTRASSSSSSSNNTNNSHSETTNVLQEQQQQPTPQSTQRMLQMQQSSELPQRQPSPSANNNNNQQLFQVRYRFLFLMTMVALLFSLLLFALLLCWVVFTSAYVVSIDKSCDVPLKTYYWLTTVQLLLDVFRTDIMKYIFHWDPITNTDLSNNSHSRQSSSPTSHGTNNTIPTRVAIYNIAYLIYAFYTLHIGCYSVFRNTSTCTCSQTAPELFTSARSFVCLSISAWITILLGYALPAGFLAILMASRRRRVLVTADSSSATVVRVAGAFVGVVQGANGVVGGMHRGDWRNVWNIGRNGAPPECIELLDTVPLHDFPEDYPKDCCICMSDFVPQDVIISTPCSHVFHKICFSEWLDLARTCPICRTDIPNSLGIDQSHTSAAVTTHASTQTANNNSSSNRHSLEATSSNLAIPTTRNSFFHWRPTFTSSDRLSFLVRGREVPLDNTTEDTNPSTIDRANEEGDGQLQQTIYGVDSPGNNSIDRQRVSSYLNRSNNRITSLVDSNNIIRAEQPLTAVVLPFGDGDDHVLPH